MVPHTQISDTAEERYRREITRELAKFEEREKEFRICQRMERAAELGLPLPELREKDAHRLS